MRTRLTKALVLLLVTFSGALALRFYTATASGEGEKEDNGYTNIAMLARAMQLIRQDYVDEKKVSYEALTHAALKGMLESLDPHSQYMEAKAFKGMQDDTNSRFGGLGVVVAMKDGVLTIITPMEDSPGSRAGLQSGDQIIKIDGKLTEKMDLSQSINQLRGENGQKITLTVLRPATKEIKDYELTRENIKIASVRDARLLPANLAGDFKVGYARITQFNVPTAADLARKLDELEKQGMQAFVLDLRGNPGGLLQSAVDVAGHFLPPKTVVVSTQGRTPSQSRTYPTSESAKPRPNYPIVVLINNGSASGAEIVAGALKDLNRAILVGETTFGKGSVQSVIQLQDRSAVRLTTAKYYTPSKQVIHEHGVTPTIRVSLSSEQERQLAMQRNEEVSPESERKELANFRDTQLERGVDILKGILIVGERTARK
jgi:carboxyl-terminal processing protease